MHKFITLNTHGTDYVVGDIHGAFEKLKVQLDLMNFDTSKDRLFSVGDLVDRGPNSHLALDWLKYNWFFPVRGNHDEFIVENNAYLQSINGGNWYLNLPAETKEHWQKQFSQIPYSVSVDTHCGKIGIVHAEVFGSWNVVELEQYSKQDLIWGRTRAYSSDTELVTDVVKIFVGHTPVNTNDLVLGNTHYLDNGAWHNNSNKPFNIQKLCTF